MKFYLVGGSIRDELMGLKSKDIDIAVEAPDWESFRDEIRAIHNTIFVEEEKFLRIKALNTFHIVDYKGPIDYTICRKDGFYSDGRRPDTVEICDILGDLSRRDFTVNAIAKDLETGEILDPFNGREDLKAKRLVCVGDPEERMKEDGLRWFRAIRFTVMKKLCYDSPLCNVMVQMMKDPDQWFKNTSTERIRDELRRCFHHDTKDTLLVLQEFFDTKMLDFFARRGLWLNPSTKQKAGHGEG